jgi:hypothetical protein
MAAPRRLPAKAQLPLFVRNKGHHDARTAAAIQGCQRMDRELGCIDLQHWRANVIEAEHGALV